MYNFKNKVVLITGGNKGIGKAMSIAFAKAKASIAFIYNKDDKDAQELIYDLTKKYNVDAKSYRCDITSLSAIESAIQYILRDFGKVDILINNAGITQDMFLMNMKEQDFDLCIDVNLKGAFFVTRALYRNFLKLKSGRIINISSIIGLHGNAGQSNYSASKSALIGFTKSIAKELASRDITVNAIAPGFIETDMTSGLSEEIKENALSSIPLKRFGKASEVADVAVFLASSNASYITGQVFVVDGGMTI